MKRQRGITCAPPAEPSISQKLTGHIRTLATKVARLDAVVDGDLICTVRGQTIAGQRIDKTILRVFSDKLLKLEIWLKFPAPPRERGFSYYDPTALELTTVVDALKGKYGKPDEYKLWVKACLCQVVYSTWQVQSAGTIRLERRLEYASEAKIVFTAAAYEKVREQRLLAKNDAVHEQVRYALRQRKEARKKELQDL